jgi:N-acetylglucosamine-6-phosphate deacetylase
MSVAAPSGTTLLRAARAVDATTTVHDAWILIDGDHIAAVGQGPNTPANDRVVDLGDATLVPGFIDLHGHGGSGGAYDDGVDEITAALRMHRQHGTTRSVLSLVANPLPTLARSVATIRRVMDQDPGILGVHLEGPFLSPRNHGAHEPRHLLHPTAEHVTEVLRFGAGVVRQITIAPELPGALEAIRHFSDAGIVVAVGHTRADAQTTQAAFDAGATLLTHAFNAMPAVHHRDPGPIPAAIGDPRVTMELILDGVHVDPSVAWMLFRAAPGRVALVTDAMAAAGFPDGRYRLGSVSADVVDGIARVHGTDTIAGSTLTQDDALRTATRDVGLTLQEAIGALTATPAAALGFAALGSLRPGAVTNLVALGPALNVTHVWAGGTGIRVR